MNRISVLLVISVFTIFFSCKNDPNSAAPEVQHASPAVLEGHWIAIDFCSRANQYQSVLAAMNNGHVPFSYAYSFKADQPDSVTCCNGATIWKLAVKYNVDTIEVQNARNGKSIFMLYNPQSKEITSFDATTARTAELDRYVKSKSNSPSGYLAFTTALNHNIFEGNYTPIGIKTAKPVTFTPGGYITEFPDYDRYQPCTGGDCFLLGDKMDVITLANTKDKDSKKMFGFKFGANGDTLRIYQLIPSQDQKSAAIGKVAYTFLRKVSEPAKTPRPGNSAPSPNAAGHTVPVPAPTKK